MLDTNTSEGKQWSLHSHGVASQSRRLGAEPRPDEIQLSSTMADQSLLEYKLALSDFILRGLATNDVASSPSSVDSYWHSLDWRKLCWSLKHDGLKTNDDVDLSKSFNTTAVDWSELNFWSPEHIC